MEVYIVIELLLSISVLMSKTLAQLQLYPWMILGKFPNLSEPLYQLDRDYNCAFFTRWLEG